MKATEKSKEYMRQYYITHRDKFIKRRRIHYQNNKSQWKEKQNTDEYRMSKIIYNRRRRKEALAAYGNKCACCGEDRFEFLAIDHIDGNGNTHRKTLKNRNSICQWLKTNNYPEGFRILCHNCNLSLGFYKYCPHNKL